MGWSGRPCLPDRSKTPGRLFTTVDGSESGDHHLGWMKPIVSNGINYRPNWCKISSMNSSYASMTSQIFRERNPVDMIVVDKKPPGFLHLQLVHLSVRGMMKEWYFPPWVCASAISYRPHWIRFLPSALPQDFSRHKHRGCIHRELYINNELNWLCWKCKVCAFRALFRTSLRSWGLF